MYFVNMGAQKKKDLGFTASHISSRSLICGRKPESFGENLIDPCSQVHDNFTLGVNRKILIDLIYFFIKETYLTCANGL